MASLLLGLRRQIARNRRKDAYTTRYVPKATPMPAVADGKIRIEPENLDYLDPEEESVQPVTIIQTPSQTQIQSTEEKMEEPEAMEEFGTEDKNLDTEVNHVRYEDAPLQAVPEQEFKEEEPEQPLSMFEDIVSSELNTIPEAEIQSEAPEQKEFYTEMTVEEEKESEVSSESQFIPSVEPAVRETAATPQKQEAATTIQEQETAAPQVDEITDVKESHEEESLHGPESFEFSTYEAPKADMFSNGVKPFDFDNYKENEEESNKEPEPVFSETIRESDVAEESKEDFLMKEIDEFRDRAKRLQMLLDNRETEAQKLKSIVDERQEKADALQEKADELDQILQERQQEADGITAQVERQIDALIEKVSVKMDELEASMADQNEDGRRFSEQKAKELKETLGQIQEQLTTLKTELSDKVHSENVKCFRNISDVLKGTEQKIDAISELEDTVDEKIAPVKLLGISSLVVGVINFIAIIILMIASMISTGAVG